MPKAGYKSVTVTDKIYDQFYEVYLQTKDELYALGIHSFAAYITHLIEETLKNDEIFTKFKPRYEKILIEKNRIILKDNHLSRVVEISVYGDKLRCQLCESNKCVHIGYCYSLHQIYPLSVK